MATITKSIGTSSRDYSTITAWEADLDNTGIYTSGDDAVGECYNDAAFDESVGIDGGSTVGLNSIKLTAANGEKHDGTEGTGARIVSSTQIIFIGTGGSVDKTISFIEVDKTAAANANITMISLTGSAGSGATNNLHACIVHGAAVSTQNYRSLKGVATGSVAGITYNITNNIVYDITHASGGNPAGITTATGNIYIYNCTVHDITEPGGTTGSCFSVTCNDLRNCIATDCSGNDFATGTISGTESNNLSSDSTASGTGSLTGKTAANQFVSTVAGSEDLHLLSTADAVGAGADLATTSIDINGSDRNALAATVWDIGAHQYASTASIGTSSRDYSTITLWEADLDDTTIYGAGANAVGECYNDSTFALTDHITLRGGGVVGLSSVTVTAAQADRHDGTADTGVKITFNAFKAFYAEAGKDASTRIPTIVEWLDIDGQGFSRTFLIAFYDNTLNSALRNCITRGPGDQVNAYLQSYNNIAYGSSGGFLTNVNFGNHNANHYNNTIRLPVAYRVTYIGTGTVNIKNILATSDNPHPTYGLFSGDYLSSANNASNISSDGTAIGTNSQTNKSAANQFVSTLSGSEDLHIVETSDAFGAGVDLGTVVDGVQYDIDGTNRDAFTGTSWDIGADQVYITASIGTSSRDYSTIGLWEADLDDTSLYTSGDDAVGECYNDSTFTLGANIDGGTTAGLSSVTLSVAEGERHDGTLSAGVFINPAYSIGSYGLVRTARSNTTIEWLTCEVNGTSTYAHTAIIVHDIYSSNTLSRNMVLKGEDKVYPAHTPVGIRSGGHENIAHNNIIYGIANGNTGAGIQDSYRRCNALSNTIYGCNYGYQATAQGGDARNVKNNLSIGNNSDFYAAGTTGYASSNNASSDSTATVFGGSNHVTGAPASRQFVSTLSGSEDLHLIFKSAAIDAGVDLGAASGVQYDINGKDRDTENSIWDIGAHEYGDNVIFGLLRV